jgi:DNA-binding IclR family transcriptional regulator
MPTTYPISAAYVDGQVLTAANVNGISTAVNEIAALQLNAQTGTSYTLALTDAAKMVTLSNAAAITLNINTDANVNFAIGTQIMLYQGGAGQVTIAATTPGTTSIRSQGSKLKITGQYGVAVVMKIAANEWVAFGNLSA